jgi:predicted ribosomally synthesized peptide with nif11-like leader
MSQADATSFVVRVATNEAFRRDVMSELQGTVETSPEQLVEFGGRYGLTFTATELADVLSASQPGHEQLDESELESISGGAIGELLLLQQQIVMQRENQVFSSISNVLKLRHDTAKNSISNVR